MPTPRRTGSIAGRGWDVLGIGAVAVDDLLYVDAYPGPDSKVRIRSERREGGGLVATALVTVARLGGSSAFLAVLGHDELSVFAIRELERAGVDGSRIIRRAAARPVHSRIIVDGHTGQRTILYSMTGVIAPSTEEIAQTDVETCRVLLVDSTVVPTACHAARLARRSGIPVVADLEHPDEPGVDELMNLVDHLVVGSRFAVGVTGERAAAAVHRLWRPGMAACVVTAGEEGCWFRALETDGRVRHAPALPVQAVDTNGCGDVFHGAYAARIAMGDGVAAAVTAATRMAAAKAARGGGWDAIPMWSDLAGQEVA